MPETDDRTPDEIAAANTPEATAAAEEARFHATIHNEDNTPVTLLRAAETLAPGDSLRGLWMVCGNTGIVHVLSGTQHLSAEPGDSISLALDAATPVPDHIAARGYTPRERAVEAVRPLIAAADEDNPLDPDALVDAVLVALTP